MASNIKEEVLSGKAMWAKLHTPDMGKTAKWTPKYVVDVLLNKNGIEKAKELGLEMKKDRDAYKGLFDGYDGTYVKFTRPTKNGKGDEVQAPKVVDSKLRVVPSSVLIGNGSDVDVKFFVKTQTGKQFGEYGGYLLAVKIVNLVEPPKRAADPESDFVESDGFEVAGNSGSKTSLGRTVSSTEDDDEIPF